ncbi:DHH family phosphoesterase [Clostridia bacterium]|nr:DHH family phosphoesterase [Clostridia bacterium]
MGIQELIGILKKCTGRIFIQTHNFPDADAITSAFGLQKLFEYFELKSSIIYIGKVEKFNISLMLKMFEITITDAASITDMNMDDFIVVVDAQKNNANILDVDGDEVACIDHHPIFAQGDYQYSDIRPGTGACASIIASYFFEEEIPLDQNTATALLYGIKMDTLDLSRGVSPLDIDMFYQLFKIANTNVLSKMQANTLEFHDLIGFGEAIQNIRVYDNLGVARIDVHCPDALIAAISDFILSTVEIEIAIVYNFREDGIKFSVRNEVPNLDAGKATQQALSGIGSGGGHAFMAGGFIPHGYDFDGIDDVIRDRFLRSFGKI